MGSQRTESVGKEEWHGFDECNRKERSLIWLSWEIKDIDALDSTILDFGITTAYKGV